MPKSIRSCDTVLLKVEKSDKLLPNFRPSPFKVDQKAWTEVTVRNDAGDEFIRNTAIVKKYNEKGSVSRPVGKENSSPEEIEQREKSCPTNDDRRVWKQPSASSEFTGKGSGN